HLIENGEETVVVKRIRKRTRKRIKKVVSSSPTTSLSPPSTTTPPSTTPSPSTPPPPSTLPPLLTPVAEARRFVLPRAAVAPTFQHQVSPAAVERVQLQPAVARAAPIYRPDPVPSLLAQPQYYPPPPSAQPAPFQSLFQPLLPLQQQPILRYEPVVYYRPVYGRKKRETEKSKHAFLFKKEQKEI
ncbi:hypothetical protein PMAYCL1PPCAC_06540, partial [Pristionchus mayeri]